MLKTNFLQRKMRWIKKIKAEFDKMQTTLSMCYFETARKEKKNTTKLKLKP